MAWRAGLWRWALLALPGVLTAWFAFEAGGFFAGTPALAAVFLTGVLIVHITTQPRPLEGVGVPVVVAAGAFGALAAWSLLSSTWSHAPGRAVVEFDRALLYALLVLLMGLLPRSPGSMRLAVRWVIGALVIVAGAGFLARSLPDVVHVQQAVGSNRLSFPTTYWNATAICAALGALLCLYATTDRDEPAWVRVGAAAGFPLCCTTLLLTFSRGGIAAGVVGAVLFLALGRPRALVPGLIATVPAAVFALLTAYGADALASRTPTSPDAVDQGGNLALVVAFCVVGAGVLRAILLRYDGLNPPPLDARGGQMVRGAVAAVALVVVVAAVAAGLPGKVRDQYDGFLNGDRVADTGDVRDRLTNPGNNGRVDLWRVARRSWAEHPLRGTGAGTYQVQWLANRPNPSDAVDGHSLLFETMSDLGLIGLVLLAVGIGTLLFCVGRLIRPPNRPLYAAVFAALVAWLLQAGIDWSWEMPATVTAVLGLGALALGAPATFPGRGELGRSARVAAGAALLVVAITPGQMALSQHRLNDAIQAFRGGDCRAAIDRALASHDALGARPEPFQVLAYCDARLGKRDLALRAADNAISRDPRNWQGYYDLALVRGAFELDPRPAARRALALNPESLVVKTLVNRLDTDKPAEWRKRARSTRLLIAP